MALLAGLMTLVFFPVVLVVRFLSGRVLWRPASSWDARYSSWAADPPAWVYAMRNEPYPRSRWARRPGWHRQLVRLAPLVAAVAVLHAPTADSVTAAVLALGAVALVVTRRRPRPRRSVPAPRAAPAITGDDHISRRRAVPPSRTAAWDVDDPEPIYSPRRPGRRA